MDGSPLSNVAAARVPSPMHGGRFRREWVGYSEFLLLSSSQVIPRPPAPPRLHWLSDVAVGGAWAAPRARLASLVFECRCCNPTLVGCWTCLARGGPARGKS